MQADLKTFAALQVYGMSVLTLATDCTTEGVTDLQLLTPEFVAHQFRRVTADIAPAAIKTGMLFSAEIIEQVDALLSAIDHDRIIIDPVMTTRRGERLLSDDAEAAMRALVGRARIVTPSLPEAGRLVQRSISSSAEMIAAAKQIHRELGARHVVITDGHGTTDTAADCWFDGEAIRWLEADRLPFAVHGAGDAFSAAATAHLGMGYDVERALDGAKAFVTEAIRNATPRGQGNRPLAYSLAR